MKVPWYPRVRLAFAWERVLSRLLASWCWFAALVVLSGFDFTALSFAQDISLVTAGLAVIGFFASRQ